MKTMKKVWKSVILTALAVLFAISMTVSADEASGDNSLYSLGLENGECSPEFYYSTLEYNVTVPAGTKELQLDPITSASDASIIDISGTELDENGKGTVYITVEAANGAQVSYVLNVSADSQGAATEAATETEMSDEQKYEEELKKQAESEEAARQEAELQAKVEQADKLSAENDDLTEKLNILLKVLYGLIGFAVILLFFIINQSLRNKDLKDDLKEARAQADLNTDFARRSENMRSDYYYAPQNVPQNMGRPMMDASANVQAAFGNAPQVLYAQPAPGQVNPPVQTEAAEAPLSHKEQKKMEKAAKKAAKEKEQSTAMNAGPVQTAPVSQAPVQTAVSGEPTLVRGNEEEPDVNVDMIDL